MSERFSGKVEVTHEHQIVTISLDGDTGDIYLGGVGLYTPAGQAQKVHWAAAGNLQLRNMMGVATISLDGASGRIHLGTDGQDGSVHISDKTGKERVLLEGQTGAVIVGGGGAAGQVLLLSSDGSQIMELSAAPPHYPNAPNMPAPNVILGKSHGCVISIRGRNGTETISLDGPSGAILLGGNGADGDVVVRNEAGKETIRLDGQSGDLTLGGNGADGDVVVRNEAGKETIRLDGQSADLTLGGNGADGDVIVRDQTGKETVRIDGQAGDIILQNADCAEDFDASELDGIEAGTVVVLDPEGRLRESKDAYDTRVAGVVSGAGDNKPGIVLDKKPVQTNRLPLALVGKVYCKADALFGPIQVGDLLTTSSMPGHAMKASDPAKAFGAVIGKALGSLKAGTGLIPIIVALQ